MEEYAQLHVMPFQLRRAECDYTWLMHLSISYRTCRSRASFYLRERDEYHSMA